MVDREGMSLRLVPSPPPHEPDDIAPGESFRVQVATRLAVTLFALATDRTEMTLEFDGVAVATMRASLA